MGNSKRFIRAAIVLILALTLVWCGLSFSAPAQAQTEPASLKNVVLSIYPEYDDPLGLEYPSVLVMLDGQIEGSNPPMNIRFLVPTGSVLYSAGSGPRQNYVGGPPNRKTSNISGWDEISYELKTDSFVVEYYMPVQTSADKAFSVDFIPLYDVNGLVVQVQQPRQANDFAVVAKDIPSNQQQSTSLEGLAATNYSYDSLKKDSTSSFSILYTKKNLSPSLEITDTSSTAKNNSSQTPLVVLIVVLGVIVLGIAGYLVIKRTSSARPARSKAYVRPQTRVRSAGRFCTECGAELGDSQRFCGNCGAKRR